MAKAKTVTKAPKAVSLAPRWRRLQRRLEALKKSDPTGYTIVCSAIDHAAARNGAPMMTVAAPEPGALIDFLKGLLALLPDILSAIEAIIALFN